MATGYTDPVRHGQSARDFMISCARAMGVAITMRDEPRSKQIPKEFEPSDWHVKQGIQAQQRLDELKAMSTEQVASQARKAYDDAISRHRQLEKDREQTRKAYESVLAKVQMWTPPTADHEGYKQFMVDQLIDSIKWDCDSAWPEPDISDYVPEIWYENQLSSCLRDIRYHRKNYQEELQRIADRNAWLKAFWDSLPEEE